MAFAPAHTLQDQLHQGNVSAILEAISDTEPFVGRHHISFPRIAVIGDESTGKSSVLEAICKIPFPRGQTTTTRCPIQVHLNQRAGKPWSATAWTGTDDGDKENLRSVDTPESLTSIIADLQDIEVEVANQKSIIRGGAEFSHVPISIRIEADDAIDLTIIDLPGYFSQKRLQEKSTDAKKGQGDVKRVKSTLVSYIKDPNTILLVIVPANQYVGTANIVSLVRECEKDLPDDQVDPFYNRIIYCFTKVSVPSQTPTTHSFSNSPPPAVPVLTHHFASLFPV